jgi:hypothetical protein
MKQTTFQHPELRDANDNIIQEGTYGKASPLVNSDNTGVLDYINNNLMYLYNNTMGGTGGEINAETITGKTGTITNLTATTVNAGTVTADALNGPLTGNVTGNLTGDVTGNLIGDVTGNLSGNVTGDVTGNLTGDATGNLTGTADKAIADGSGNNIANTYVTKSALASSVTTATGNVTTLTATDTTLTNVTITGETSVPTANAGNSSKAIANTEFVAKSLAALVDSAPAQLNTLNELATALGNDANFAATITAELAKKLNSAEAESTYATKTEAGVPYQIKRNTAYKVGDVLTSPSLPPGCVIVVTQAGTTGSTEPDWATIKSNMGGVITDNTVTFYINDTLSKHSVGDIVYKPMTKVTEHEYLLPLDGQTIDGVTYKRLVDYLGTNVLPNLNGRYLRADTTPGKMVEAGLPNITGNFGSANGAILSFFNIGEGAFSAEIPGKDSRSYDGLPANTTPYAKGYTNTINFNASSSSSIYGKSTTVTPLTYTVRAYIAYA